ncbi:MAG TPA: calcium-translocating P-type ATPase, PMCA-type [Deltaproteobacteria bacterium]|nr:calcium-translocating P-type ATPase, PMCA-type [Deltaproteobacteria bacterium]
MKFDYTGLTEAEAAQSRQEHGSNALTQQHVETFWDKLLANLRDPIIIILIVALGVTVLLAVLGFAPWYEGVGIAIAVVMATMVATWSEFSNENEFQRLMEEASKITVKTFRNGRLDEVLIDDLVVNDLILLQPGDTVPADGVLIAGHLELNESALTGEPEPVKKQPLAEGATLNEDQNGLSRAALVDDGEGVMHVTAAGDKTTYGASFKDIAEAETRLSPLQEKLADLGQKISQFGYIGALFIAFSFMFNRIFFQYGDTMRMAMPDIEIMVILVKYFTTLPFGKIAYDMVTAIVLAIIIIVVAVPEGLPMMIAVVLSLNMRKLLRANVLVRKLLGIETSGSLTVLFTDKTGTLTAGHLQVAEIVGGDAQHYKSLEEIPDVLQQQVAFALRNNTSASVDASDPQNPLIVGANSTEKALLQFLGPKLAEQDNVEQVASIPFNSAYKFSAAQVQGDRSETLVKGAAEIILSGCSHYLDAQGNRQALADKDALLQEMQGLSGRAMRLIGLAVTDQALGSDPELPGGLTLVSVFGLRDEIRKESQPAVKRAHSAGIQVVMITGDAKDTAEAIAKEVGILEDDEHFAITSKELGEMSDDEVKRTLPNLRVVARALPTDKSRLVKLAKEMNWVVGMTGDGVNDAPAVKNADVGFAMGSGTDLTKESGHIIILDNNFLSLTNAVLYGRTLIKSIRKFLIFQLSVNVAAILVAFLGPFLGIDLPLTMTQLLWINIVMDTLAAFAFSGEAALTRYMREKPVPKDASLITGDMWSAIIVGGITIATLSLFFLTSPFVQGLFPCDERCGDNSQIVLLTAFFGFFVFVNNFNKFNARTEGLNLFEHLTENRNFIGVVILIFILQVSFTYFGGEILRTVGLTLQEWLYVLGFAFIIVPVDLARKFLRNLLVGNPVAE